MKAFLVIYKKGRCESIKSFGADAAKARLEYAQLCDREFDPSHPDKDTRAKLYFADDADAIGVKVGDPYSETDDFELPDFLQGK